MTYFSRLLSSRGLRFLDSIARRFVSSAFLGDNVSYSLQPVRVRIQFFVINVRNQEELVVPPLLYFLFRRRGNRNIDIADVFGFNGLDAYFSFRVINFKQKRTREDNIARWTEEFSVNFIYREVREKRNVKCPIRG